MLRKPFSGMRTSSVDEYNALSGQVPLFRASDQLASLDLPQDDRLRGPAKAIEAAMKAEERNAARKACTEFLAAAADFYHVPTPAIRVLASRPLRVREGG